MGLSVSNNHVQTIRDRDTWAIYKLWTNWNVPADLRLDVEGGHLYRRGSYAVLSEAGAVTAPGLRHCHHAGETEQITIRIGGSPKQATGYQLAIALPDKETETALKQFYDAVLNGGAVNDQKGFDFGNETDGWYYAGSCWMYGAALAAGTPAAGPLSAHPYDAARAFREHLAHVLGTLDEQSRACFGYNQGGEWVDDNLHTIIGTRFCDLCQWPPIAVGIASPEQARKIVATADARIAELEKEYGYAGYAGLSALWPVPQQLNPHAWQTFGRYMNGGSLLCQTYWEIVARCRAGDAAGAARRLKQFARRAAETHWAGDNAANIRGEMANGDGEPYLADMVAVTAAVVHGVLGIEPRWEQLTVTPRLPRDWPRAEVDVLYKGRRHHVVIENETPRIEPLEQVLRLPLLWVMDFNLRRTADAPAQTTNAAFLGHYGERLPLAEGAVSGTYQSPAHEWGAPASVQELTVAVELNGGEVSVVIETSDDGFKTVASASKMPVRDGVNAYALTDARGRALRVRFEILRQTGAAAAPVIDGFRVTADLVQKQFGG